jgi:hypothetical protein
MSLRGQWIARYSGSNTGTVVIDLDEFEDHFAGTAIAWDDNATHPNSFVQIRTQHKSDINQLTNVPTTYIDNFGNVLSRDTSNRWSLPGSSCPYSGHRPTTRRKRSVDKMGNADRHGGQHGCYSIQDTRRVAVGLEVDNNKRLGGIQKTRQRPRTTKIHLSRPRE